MNDLVSKIINSNKVLEAVGEWPSFNALEFISSKRYRTCEDRYDLLNEEMDFRFYKSKKGLDGYKIKIKFIGIDWEKRIDKNRDKVESGIFIKDISEKRLERIAFEVSINASADFIGMFQHVFHCHKIEIMEIELLRSS